MIVINGGIGGDGSRANGTRMLEEHSQAPSCEAVNQCIGASKIGGMSGSVTNLGYYVKNFAEESL